jgi:hypothetical protein
MTAGDDFWDNLFLACAFAAYVEQAAVEQGPPDPEATRQRAFRYYEEALAEKNGPGPASAAGLATFDNL